MVKKIDTIARIINVGNSIGITISKDIKDLLDLKSGDYIKISVEKIEKEKSNNNNKE